MKTIGYIVIDENLSDPLTLLARSTNSWPDVPVGGILLRPYREATMFPTRAAASQAIARTEAYFAKQPGPMFTMAVFRVTAAPISERRSDAPAKTGGLNRSDLGRQTTKPARACRAMALATTQSRRTCSALQRSEISL